MSHLMKAWIKERIEGTDPTSMIYVNAERSPIEQQDILSKWATFCEDEGHIDDKELGVLWMAADALKDLPGLLDDNARLQSELAALRADVEANKPTTCHLVQMDEDSEIWTCDTCGNEWIYVGGSPVDNNVHFCARCGAKVTAILERQYDLELDEYEEVDIMPHEQAARAHVETLENP